MKVRDDVIKIDFSVGVCGRGPFEFTWFVSGWDFCIIEFI
jgi:hypothetical protein